MVTKIVASTGKERKFDVSKTEAEHANNSRNRDAFSITKANNILENEKHISKPSSLTKSTNLGETEDVLIAMLDATNVVSKVRKR